MSRVSSRITGVLAIGIAIGLLAVGVHYIIRKPVVDPKTWTKSVCLALRPWKGQVGDLTIVAQQKLGDSGTPDTTKQALVALFTGAEAASDRARLRIIQAGIPDVQGGKVVAGRFVTALTKARDTYGHARTTISGLKTDQAQPFYDAVTNAFVKLNQEYEASALDINTIGSRPLRRSFDEVPECQ